MSTLVDTLQPPPTEVDIIGRLQTKVSPSKLSLFQSCRLKFFFRYVLGLKKPKAAALQVGASVHATLKAWNRARWRQEVPAWNLLYPVYSAAWIAGQSEEPVAWENPSDEEEQKQIGWRLLETFFRESPTPLVNAALGRELLLPARRPADLDRLLAENPELVRHIDGIERPIRRPKNKDDQKNDYSGKKKSHRKKNRLLAGGRKVVYLGPTRPGRVHDKKQSRWRVRSTTRRMPCSLETVPSRATSRRASPPGSPRKSLAGGNSSRARKRATAFLSKRRVGVEHVICGVKRCRLVLETFRCWRKGLVDEVMLAASGLHNLRVITRQNA